MLKYINGFGYFFQKKVHKLKYERLNFLLNIEILDNVLAQVNVLIFHFIQYIPKSDFYKWNID